MEVKSVLHYETTSKLILMVASVLSLYPSRVKSNLSDLLKTFYHILGQSWGIWLTLFSTPCSFLSCVLGTQGILRDKRRYHFLSCYCLKIQRSLTGDKSPICISEASLTHGWLHVSPKENFSRAL